MQWVRVCFTLTVMGTPRKNETVTLLAPSSKGGKILSSFVDEVENVRLRIGTCIRKNVLHISPFSP